MTNNFTLQALPILADNFVWFISDGKVALAVDPGQSAPVIQWLEEQKLRLGAVLLTHKHHDHIAGVPDLLKLYPELPILTPATEGDQYATIKVNPGDSFTVPELGLRLDAYSTPGHTAGHLSYVGDDYLICGDSLFACGCGRPLEGGTAEQLLQSMELFRSLPDDLLVCCGHEYTLDNIKFALAVEPDNKLLQEFANKATKLREDNQPTLPTTLGQEKQINPFLRYDVEPVRQAICAHTNQQLSEPAQLLWAVREWKNNFA